MMLVASNTTAPLSSSTGNLPIGQSLLSASKFCGDSGPINFSSNDGAFS
jgi:hypothetical protein